MDQKFKWDLVYRKLRKPPGNFYLPKKSQNLFQIEAKNAKFPPCFRASDLLIT